MRCIETTLQFIKDSPARWAGRGLFLQDEGHYKRALKMYSWAIWFERRPEYLDLRGQVLEELGNYRRAVADYSEAITLDRSGTQKYLRRRGWAHFQDGALSNAEDDFTSVLQVKPNDGECLYQRGLARERLEKFDLAEQDFVCALETRFDPVSVHASLAALYSTCPIDRIRDAAKALRHSEAAVDLTHEEHWMVYSALAAAWAEAGDFEKATHFAKLALDIAPEDIKPSRLQRLRQYQQGKPFRRMKFTRLGDETR